MAAKAATKAATKTAPKTAPKTVTKAAPKTTPETAPKATPEAAPETAPKAAPKAATKAVKPEVAGRTSTSRRTGTPEKVKPHKHRWPLLVVGVLLLIVLLVVGVFSWDRWLRFDDARDFQGQWQTHGTTAVVVVDGETIKLTDDVTWFYTLDTSAKTIAYTFGNMKGSGRYRFSPDRTQLVITDGNSYSWFSTLADDIAWQVDQLARTVQGLPPKDPPAANEATVLDRLSNTTSDAPQTSTPKQPEPEPPSEPEAEPAPEPAPESAPEPAPDENGGASESPADRTNNGGSSNAPDDDAANVVAPNAGDSPA